MSGMMEPAGLTTKQIDLLFDAIDTNQSGNINYSEFLSAFEVYVDDE